VPCGLARVPTRWIFPTSGVWFAPRAATDVEVAQMDYRQRNGFALLRHEFSRRTLLWGALFILAIVVGTFVDVDALLDYLKVLHGSASDTVEFGAVMFAISAVPFLAMGMSISAEKTRNK
jgi:hypothetical protein